MKPRLTFVSPRFLFPVDSGGKIRTTQILRGMKGGAFEVTLVSPAPAEWERFRGDLDAICDAFVPWAEPAGGPVRQLARAASLFSALPVSIASDRTRAACAAVAHALERGCDLAVFDFLHADVLAPPRLAAPSVLFTHNVEAEIPARHARVATSPLVRAIWRSQHRKMVEFERQAVRRYSTVIAVSERDAAAFRDTYGAANVRCIETGVDLRYFEFRTRPAGREVVFSGSMDWLANVDAIEHFLAEIWPRVRAEIPEARFTVVGRSPPAHLVARGAELGCELTGFVPDVRPYLQRAAVYVVPLRVGGGTRLKVFEAMASGCPVVSTSIGVEGLSLTPGEHFASADAPADFARAIVGLLEDARRATRLAADARAHVARHFGHERIAGQFEAICMETCRLDIRAEARRA